MSPSGSKPLTSPATRIGRSEASKAVISVIPERPSSSAAHDEAVSRPTGDTSPIPVITIRRDIRPGIVDGQRVSTAPGRRLADCPSMADDPRPLLRRLLAAAGPSGFEQPVAAVFRDAARSFASDVRGDALGNSFAVINPGGKPRVVLTAHLDEIGFLVSHVDDLGMLWLSEVGGWHAPVVLAQRVSVQTKG